MAADGDISRLVTNDTSCTLPSAQDIKDLGGKFKTNRVQGNAAAQTREGYVEILNTADIPPAAGATTLYTAIKHVNGKAPCTAATMDAQAVELADATDAATRGYANPTGRLMANWILVNVDGMASHSGEAVAVRAVDAGGANAAGNIVWFPQTTDAPTAGAVNTLTADPLLQSAGFASEVANYDFPDLSTPYTAAAGVGAPETQARNLATQLQVTSVVNEYATSNGFSTDWVFSMPTRRYAVALNYAAPADKRLLFNAGNATHFSAANTSLNAAGTLACVTPGVMRGFDREETTQSTFVISPDTAMKLCGETSVLAFNNTGASVLGAQVARSDSNPGYASGWGRIDTTNGGPGLPLIGSSFIKLTNPSAAPGVMGTYGITWPHRYTK